MDRRSAVLLFIADPDDGPPRLMFSIRYVADEWLFVESYLFRTDDETHAIAPAGYGAIERDNGYGGIWEWYTTTADGQERGIVDAILRSKKAVLRYDGRQYVRDRTIGAAERTDLRRVLDAYAALGGT